MLCVFFLFISSANIFPSEEDQADVSSDAQSKDSPERSSEPGRVRTVSISAGPGGKVVWFAEEKLGTLHGRATVKYEDVTLKADHIWADMSVEVVEAEGNVSLETKDQSLTADHMLFDLRQKKGILKDGLSLDTPWYYLGDRMSRLNEKDSFIEGGSMTSCSLNRPHYLFSASQIVIHLKKELVAKNVVFKIGGVPLLYLPVYRRSLEPDKRARFIFKVGSNTFEGYYVKNILPVRWRMLDGSVFFNYTSRRGMNGGIEFDYDADRVKLREIFLPVPESATVEEWQAVRKKMDEILQRAQGELDRIWLKQIFVRFKIEEEDKTKARERAEKVLKECKEEGANFAQLARRWSDDKDTRANGGYLGSFVIDEEGIKKKEDTDELKPVESTMIPVISAASKLEPQDISGLIETEEGYHIIKLEAKEKGEIRVRQILIAFEPSEPSQKRALSTADEILTKLSSGVSFEELAKQYSDDKETKDKGGDTGWRVLKDLDLSFRNVIRTLEKGEISRPIITSRGVYILKLEDKEKTPSFADLARKYSQAESANIGGDIGFKNKWELPPEVRREAYRLELYNISKPIKTEGGYKIIKVDKKSRLGGDIYVRLGDLYSYQVEKNPIKLGQTWNVDIHHNQTLWRGGEMREEDPATLQERLRLQKTLGMRAELSLAGEEYKQVYQSYTPERELRSYCGLDYYWMSRTGSSGHARFIVDATRDLLGEDTNVLQKYPEMSFDSPNYRLQELPPFKRINIKLRSISDKIQGKADFSQLVRQFSDDERTKGKGGDLGWIQKAQSGINTKVESVIFDPNGPGPGEISEPIATAEGYYIVKVEEVDEEFGKRKRVKAKQIFIAIDEDLRTKDTASKLADDIYRKLVEGERPSLGFPTLDNSSISVGTEIGNYYKDIYTPTNERNIWLQTADVHTTLSKRAIIKMGVTRELNLDLSGNYRGVWHSKTQPIQERDLEEGLESRKVGERDRNVFANVWNVQASLSTSLHRIFYPTFIPRVYALKHTISPYVSFYYAPPSESESKEGRERPPLYPFGAGTWSYERKQVNLGMSNSIDIKTKYKRERVPLFNWNLSTGADYTQEPDRRYSELRNTFTIEPYKQLSFTSILSYNLNNLRTNKPLLSNFSSDLRYSDPEGRWTGYLSRRYTYDYWGKSRQFFSCQFDLRWSKTWNLSFDLEYEYDDQVKDINDITLSFHRTLHCWESRIGFSRRGTKAGYIRKDFFFSIDILADPGKALGVGYDDVSQSWHLRSLPGMGRLGGYIGTGYLGY